MNVFLHPLQIGTLATWLSVAAAASVGLLWHPGRGASPAAGEPEITMALSDIVLGMATPADPAEAEAGTSGSSAAEQITATEELPTPPEMPSISETGPLPDVPEPPARRPVASPSITRTAAPTPSSSRPHASRKSAAGSRSSSASTSRSPTGGGRRVNGGSGVSESARLAGGRMPAPSYPPEARRKGQAGTVVVEFTVDASGHVISAAAKTPSPWPLLNNEAIRTVRRWRFPPGGVMKLQRPIVFQLK